VIKHSGKTGRQVDVHGRPTTGRIVRIVRGQGHGFVKDEDSRKVFFTRGDVQAGTFRDLEPGDWVAFEVVEDAVSGPRALHLEKMDQSACTEVPQGL